MALKIFDKLILVMERHLVSLKVGFSFWKDGFGGCVAEGEGPGGREAGIGLLQGFMQKIVKSELDSGPEGGEGESVQKTV